MALKLGSLLVEKGLVTPQQVEEALKLQTIYGGRLGTNLVELGYLELDALAQALSEQTRIPAATLAEMEAVTPATLALLPRELAEKHLAFPLRADGRRLVAAVASAFDFEVVDALGFATGFRIVPKIAPELVILRYLERRYGVARKARWIRLAEDPLGERRTPIPSPSAPPPTAPASFFGAPGSHGEVASAAGPAGPVPEPAVAAAPGAREDAVTAARRALLLGGSPRTSGRMPGVAQPGPEGGLGSAPAARRSSGSLPPIRSTGSFPAVSASAPGPGGPPLLQRARATGPRPAVPASPTSSAPAAGAAVPPAPAVAPPASPPPQPEPAGAELAAARPRDGARERATPLPARAALGASPPSSFRPAPELVAFPELAPRAAFPPPGEARSPAAALDMPVIDLPAEAIESPPVSHAARAPGGDSGPAAPLGAPQEPSWADAVYGAAPLAPPAPAARNREPERLDSLLLDIDDLASVDLGEEPDAPTPADPRPAAERSSAAPSPSGVEPGSGEDPGGDQMATPVAGIAAGAPPACEPEPDERHDTVELSGEALSDIEPAVDGDPTPLAPQPAIAFVEPLLEAGPDLPQHELEQGLLGPGPETKAPAAVQPGPPAREEASPSWLEPDASPAAGDRDAWAAFRTSPALIDPPSAEPAFALQPPESAPQEPEPPPRPIAGIPLVEEALSRAASRDKIGEALLWFAEGRFTTTVVFEVRNQVAEGWMGFGPGIDQGALRRLSVRLDESSLLKQVCDQGEAAVADVAHHEADRRLFAQVRVPHRGAHAAAVAVEEDGTVQLLLWGTRGKWPLRENLAAELQRVALCTARALGRLPASRR